MARAARRLTLNIPATGGQFASEVLNLTDEGSPLSSTGDIQEVAALVETLPAGASLRLEILAVGLDARSDANWFPAATYSATGWQTALRTVAATRARIRGLSGGTAGASAVNVFWSSHN